MPIQSPGEFKKIFRNTNQGLAEIARTKEEFVLFALVGVDRAEAQGIRKFLASDFYGISDQELLAWWRTSTSGLYFHNAAGLREFLADMKQVLSQPPYV